MLRDFIALHHCNSSPEETVLFLTERFPCAPHPPGGLFIPMGKRWADNLLHRLAIL
jgi:hypothetical protein